MEKIEEFQRMMKEYNYDLYFVPTSDFNGTEYIGDYFKTREFLTGFNGSAGSLLISQNRAYLFVDGRYHIQAEKQVNNRIIVVKVGLNGVKTLPEMLEEIITDDMVIGFDEKTMPFVLRKQLFDKYKDRIKLKTDVDLVGKLWGDERPALPFSLLYTLAPIFSGKEYKDKVNELREILDKNQNDMLLLTSLEDIAWTFNLRANDIKHTPVFYSYAIITKKESILFVDKKKINDTVKEYLKENDIKVKDYNTVYDYLTKQHDIKVSIDVETINCAIYNSIKNCEITNRVSPVRALKCIKNETEIKNLRNIHAKDGAMVAKLMYYVKTNFQKEEISEISAANYVDKLRSEIEGYVDLSFETISAFNEHGPMMHYTATPESNTIINTPGLLLVDSGGHYLDGTTDITRTFGLGRINDEMKTSFTTVLKSVIALAEAKFLEGTTTQVLDILARMPVWKCGLDYKCGTGHGVGYLLSVHEGPNSFRWNNKNAVEMKPGMITTNEPGIYLENKYGIRIENEMLCVEAEKNENGNFLEFETITYAPIDLDCIKVSLLTKSEKEWLNNYHELVYKKINRYLTKPEKEWLKEYTKKK